MHMKIIMEVTDDLKKGQDLKKGHRHVIPA